jgi:hypothetical protein
MAVVKRNLNDFQSQSHTTTFGMTFAFNMFGKESQFGTFHIVRTSFVV